ncbi:MAG TPA: substrate-binding domain-containing protein, partial [Methylomirabilota bacterium]|nr:substrate-binding domain-containing protein [Methylomirabilota bacterium]
GYACFVYESREGRGATTDDEAEVKSIGAWLSALPKPVGVFACYDFRGRQVLDACRRIKVAVPEEVAVIGVDDDEMLCSLSDPPMSSVIPNTHRTGYEAAALLERLMNGEPMRAEAHFIPPLGVRTRRSTDVLAIEDTNLSRAVRFIREHACEGISMKHVLRAVPQSRRVLENRFKNLLGRTPHEEILRIQLDRVKMLLSDTDLPLVQIAEQAGFAHVEYLSTVFKKKVGMPPSRFRELNRGARASGRRIGGRSGAVKIQK